MARHGENIRKRPDGRWEGRYPVYSVEKEKKVYRSVYGRSYEEAKTKLADCKNGRQTGTQEMENRQSLLLSTVSSASATEILAAEIRFGDATAGWLETVRLTRKPSTYAKYRSVYQKHLEPSLHARAVAAITQALAEEILSDPLSESIAKSAYCVINQILSYASRQYGLTLPKLKRPAGTGETKPAEALSRKEQEKLLTELDKGQDRYSPAVFLCMYTGLRLGEVCALQWSDLDEENRLLTVGRTVQRLYTEDWDGKGKGKTRLWETEPKSRRSRREIPLPEEVLRKLAAPAEGDVYIFGGKKPLDPRTMQNHWKRILREARIEEKKFHTLRHTFATNCIEGGMDVKSLSELLGHSDVQLTLARYVHPSMETKRRHMEVLSRFYGQICGQVRQEKTGE